MRLPTRDTPPATVSEMTTRRERLQHRPSRRLRPPADPACITVPLANGALSAGQIFTIISTAADWRPADHPRTPMAFALAPGWVFKSNLSWRERNRARAIERVMQMIELTAKLGVWHPARTWFLLHDRRRYVPCNATPLLMPPPQAGVRRLLSWFEQQHLIVRAAAYGVRLDHQPYNFGCDRDTRRLYYLDDEVYPLHG
jgi:hypothetical protein